MEHCSTAKRAARSKPAETKNYRSLSHAMSWALRHAAPELGLAMSSDGYVPVQELLGCGHKRFRGWTEQDVRHVVETNDKQRYKLTVRRTDNGELLCVRANQGHSIPNIDPDVLLTRLGPEQLEQLQTVVHGTFWKAWRDNIQSQGLSRMNRNHIHFATGMPKDKRVISGMRKSCEIFIFLNMELCSREGIEFYQSENGVVLTAGVDSNGMLPTRFFARVVSSSGEVLLEETGTM